MSEYNEFKYRRHKWGNGADLIVLMKVGDFYETYDDDAKECKKVLGLQVDQRTDFDLTGFPKFRLQEYVTRLVKAGYQVVASDGNEDNHYTKENLNQYFNNQTTNIMEKIFATIREKNVYWFNTEREALVKLVIRYSSFNLDTHKTRHEWALAGSDGKDIVLAHDYDPQEPNAVPTFYKTVDDFEKGKTMTTAELYMMQNEDMICSPIVNARQCKRTFKDDAKGCYIWAFVKGQAMKWFFNDHVEIVTWKYVDGFFATAKADIDVPENYWSAEDVYQYNDWTEVDADGNRTVHEGVYNRLRLEPDQEEMMDKFQAMIDECMEKGIRIYFSQNDYCLNAVNVRKVKCLEYEPEHEEETETVYDFDDSRVSRVLNGVYDINTEGGEVKFVIKKKQEA